MTTWRYDELVRARLMEACGYDAKLCKVLMLVFHETQLVARKTDNATAWASYPFDCWCEILAVNAVEFLSLKRELEKKGLIACAHNSEGHHLLRPTQKAIKLAAACAGGWLEVLVYLPLHETYSPIYIEEHGNECD